MASLFLTALFIFSIGNGFKVPMLPKIIWKTKLQIKANSFTQSKVVHESYLENGLKVIVLPNKNPIGRFEAHLEILAGSSFEKEHQQGMAHLLEHVLYMGSENRQKLSGSGSQTNAYTDFHHTVFFAACPNYNIVDNSNAEGNKYMLPLALDALLDVMSTKISSGRLEQERAAVLSELSMINTIQYRVECQLIKHLHGENLISKRFPCGKEECIREWTSADLQAFHHFHYRPNNAVLYVVGDVDVSTVQSLVADKFGSLVARPLDAESELWGTHHFPKLPLRLLNRHFPPVVHRWTCSNALAHSILSRYASDVDLSLLESSMMALPPPPNAVQLFQHKLLNRFSFHLFAKRPILQLTDRDSMRMDLIRQIVTKALETRLGVDQREEAILTSLEMHDLDWPREGICLTSLDVTTDPAHWRRAVQFAVVELKRIATFGLSQSEFQRQVQGFLYKIRRTKRTDDDANDAETNADVIKEIMQTEACGHVYLTSRQKEDLQKDILAHSLSLEDVNAFASSVYASLFQGSLEDQDIDCRIPLTFASCPLADPSGDPIDISPEQIQEAVLSAAKQEITPLDTVAIPQSLIDNEELQRITEEVRPFWKGLREDALEEGEILSDIEQHNKISRRQLSNGVFFNAKTLTAVPGQVYFRLFIPGGRIGEDDGKVGSSLLGARTMQEGGAIVGMDRKVMELFCVDHMVDVLIESKPGGVVVDLQTSYDPTVAQRDMTSDSSPPARLSGLEAAFQVLNTIISQFVWEKDAFQRAKLFSCNFQNYDDLETQCQEQLIQAVTEKHDRFNHPGPEVLHTLTFDDAKSAVAQKIHAGPLEVTVSGDATLQDLNNLALRYLGPLKPRLLCDAIAPASFSASSSLSKDYRISLEDTDERALGYLAGKFPNEEGYLSNGKLVAEEVFGSTELVGHRKSKLFSKGVLAIIHEIVNRELFSVLREEKSLTYDASFKMNSYEGVVGGWFLVTVTSSPKEVDLAVQACREVLGTAGRLANFWAVASAKQTILSKRSLEQSSNKFWIDSLSGSQIFTSDAAMVGKETQAYEDVFNAITVEDVRLFMKSLFDFNHGNSIVSCVGVSKMKND